MMKAAVLFLAISLVSATSAGAQLASRDGTPVQAGQGHRTRLILKDGSYQQITGFKVVGNKVRYVSAERGGESEEIPLDKVDLEATKRWAADHAAGGEGAAAPAVDAELAKEEAERAALTPEVAKDLRLPEADQVVVLDTFEGGPELVPLAQQEGELNKQTGHSILKGKVNPLAAPHQMVVLKGEKADVQMHVEQPEFYVRLDDAQSPGGMLTVDTHGASSASVNRGEKRGDPHEYVIVRTDVRQDARYVPSVNTTQLGGGPRQPDVTEMDYTVLPGGHWLKLVPKQKLLFGEYALLEVLGERAVNLQVWDFGVHPNAPENRDIIVPEKRRPVVLERRPH